MTPLPLRLGDRGEPVRDLQRRLLAVHADFDVDETGDFGPETDRCVRLFQTRFGLDVHGVCDDLTWATLVEAGYRFGDRQLYHRSPMMRGEDIGDLQRRLGALGFDPGRADGIFGPRTAAAVAEFQRNVGLTSDGISGPDTVAALHRLGTVRTDAVPVSLVREREQLRCAPRHIPGHRIVLGHPGGLAPLVQATHRLLRDARADVLTLHHPDGSVQAQHANQFRADVFVALRLATVPGVRAAYFKGTRFESAPGRRLAELMIIALGDVLGALQTPPDVGRGVPRSPARDAAPPLGGSSLPGPLGMRLPILRETRMPAVLVEIGPPWLVVVQNERLAVQIVQAIEAWVDEPLPAPV